MKYIRQKCTHVWHCIYTWGQWSVEDKPCPFFSIHILQKFWRLRFSHGWKSKRRSTEDKMNTQWKGWRGRDERGTHLPTEEEAGRWTVNQGSDEQSWGLSTSNMVLCKQCVFNVFLLYESVWMNLNVHIINKDKSRCFHFCGLYIFVEAGNVNLINERLISWVLFTYNLDLNGKDFHILKIPPRFSSSQICTPYTTVEYCPLTADPSILLLILNGNNWSC